MTKILYCKERPYLYIPEKIVERYRAVKGNPEKLKLDRADQDLIRCIEEYADLHPEDEDVKHLGIANIGNATRYLVVEHNGWENIYTEDTLPWKTVGVNDNDWRLSIFIPE